MSARPTGDARSKRERLVAVYVMNVIDRVRPAQ